MESFMKAADDLDLDKLLDDFERSEGFGPAPVPSGLKSVSQPVVQNGIDAPLQNGTKEESHHDENIIYESDLLIDLSEADFAPAVQSSSILASLTPGVLQPTKPSLGQQDGDDDSNTQLGNRDFSSYLHKDSTVNTLEGLSLQAAHKPPAPNILDLQTDVTIPTTQVNSDFTSKEYVAPSVETTEGSGIQADSSLPKSQLNSGFIHGQHMTPIPTIPGSQHLQTNVNVLKPQVHSDDNHKETTNAAGRSKIEAESFSGLPTPSPVVNNVPRVEGSQTFTVPRSNGLSDTAIQEIPTENFDSLRREDLPAGFTDAQLLDPSLMKQYLEQGARPKVPVAKTPDQEDEATPTPVGFGDTADISVSEEDLDALEAEMKAPQGGPAQTAIPQQPTEGQGSQVSPTSKPLTDEPGTQGGVNPTNNELAGLDPFLQSMQEGIPTMQQPEPVEAPQREESAGLTQQPQTNGESTYVPVQDPFTLTVPPEQSPVPASQIDEEVRPLPATEPGTSQSQSTLPPDPPSYQQVQEWKAAELERNQVSREGLTLDFNQPPAVTGQRRGVGLQPLPPSPIVEEVGVTTGYVRDRHTSRRRQRQAGTEEQPTNDDPENLTVDVGGVPVRLGDVAPVWIPDTDAASCMKCDTKFTFTKRRHHCRACGKVFCVKCCNVRVKLKYMKTREARVCSTCLNAILTAEAMQRVSDAIQSNENSPENSGTTGTEDQQQPEEEQPAVQRSLLRTPSIDGSQRRESTGRRVRFSDGVPAGLDRGEPDGSTQPRTERSSRRRLSRQRGSKSFIPESEGMLPPRLVSSGAGEFRVVESPKVADVMNEIRNEAADPVTFLLSKALQVHVKIVNLNCCVNRVCWCFTTKGLATVGQDEIVFVLECLPDETSVPRDMLLHIYNLYQGATKGNTVQHLGHCVFTHNFLDSRDHAGFLYLRPTYQCQQKLILPEQPYLYGILLQKWELPWAKIFPVRLMLRLGAEFRYYPCPLMSVRFRKPVFQEIGHTIMNLLADFKNYQYMLPLIRGVVVHMQDHETIIHLPKNRYDDVMKVINNSNEHVMAIAANFSPEADSHLVCIQNDQGVYQTQAINRQNKPRKVTGASFMVLNGALKSNSGLTAKSSIVEDGLMVQIRPEMMASLRDALRNMADFTIPCGSSGAAQPDETVILRWVEDDKSFNSGVKSPVDGKTLEGVESIRIQNTTDFQGQNKIIRWTEVFFIENGGGSDSRKHIPEPVDLSRLAENLAIAFCLALSESLQDLQTLGLSKLGLRVTVDLENVGYEVGSLGTPLPDQYMNNLDDLLIPVLHNAVSQQEGGPVVLELIFYILD